MTRSENMRRINWKHGQAFRDRPRTRAYKCWMAMRKRCFDKKCKDYPKYGGAGVRIADEWSDYAVFLADMGECPSPRHSLDRYPNRAGDYEPGNVRWATLEEQNSNRDYCRMLTLEGRTQTMSQWAREYRITPRLLHERLGRGWPLQRALISDSKRTVPCVPSANKSGSNPCS